MSTITNPFTKHRNRLRRDSHNTRWISDSDNVTRQSREQVHFRNKAQHMSEPCPRHTSPTKPVTYSDSESIYSLGETEQQQREPEERASFPTPWHRTAKAIYDSGPQGEGQEVWKAWKFYQRARKEQRDSDEMGEKRESVQREVVLEDKEVAAWTLQMRQLVPHSPLPSPLPQVGTVQNQFDGTEQRSVHRHTREDSCVSPSSIDIPVSIGDCIQRIIYTNKPLPTIPHSKPPPETHETVRPTAPASPPLIAKPFDNTERSTKKLRSEVKLNYSRWKKHHSSKIQGKLKAKISHPIPLTASYQGSATNIAAECGGIGGPAAAGSLPIARTGAAQPQPQPQPQSRNMASANITEERGLRRLPSLSFHVPSLGHIRMKSAPEVEDKHKAVVRDEMPPRRRSGTFIGPAYEVGKSIKQSAKEKLDGVHVVRRRRSSDASFVCQGVVDRALDSDQASEMGAPAQSSGEDAESLLPEPLFTGMWSCRNSQFYQPYVEALEEY